MSRMQGMKSTLFGLLAVVGMILAAAGADAQTTTEDERATWTNPEKRDLDAYELDKKNLAIDGYDPVAYFKEGGGKPKKGSKKITHTHRGVTYRFANKANKDRFIKNPDTYEPAHGGWCSYAMAKGSRTEPNPKRFVIQNGRLFLFYDGLFGDTYKDWHKEGPEKLEKQADTNWEKDTGERARLPEDA